MTYKGETHCLAEWGRILEVSDNYLSTALQMGIPFEEAIEIIKRAADWEIKPEVLTKMKKGGIIKRNEEGELQLEDSWEWIMEEEF